MTGQGLGHWALLTAMLMATGCSDDDTSNHPAADSGVMQKDGGGAPKTGTGNMGIFIIGPSGGLKDAKVALAKKAGDGPIYYGDNIKPDPSKTGTAKHGHLLWFNIPAGDHELIGTPPNRTVVCKTECARSGSSNNRFKVTIKADSDTFTQVICKSLLLSR